MSLTTEINSSKEELIISYLRSIEDFYELIYKELDQSNNSDFLKGKIVLAIDTLQNIKKDYGI